MTALWVIPGAIAAIGAVLAAIAISRLSTEASGLRTSLQSWGQLRPALVELRSDADRVRARLDQLRSGR